MSTAALFEQLTAAGWQAPPLDEAGVYRATDEQPDVSYAAEGIEQLAAHSGGHWWNEHRLRWIGRQLDRLGDPPLIEVGAGSGAVSCGLAAAGRRVVAVEPHHSGARHIAGQGVPAVWGRLVDLALPDGSVPALGYFDVLEHLPDPGAELAEARRVLGPGGLVLVTVPAFGWLWSDEDVAAGHQCRYGRGQLVGQFRAAGFEPVGVEYLFATLVPAAVALRRVPYLVRQRRRGGAPEVRPVDLSGQLAPPRPVEAVANAVLRTEEAVARVLGLPFGLSLAAVFRVASSG
jgi:SAM-dependent methyltransferase